MYTHAVMRWRENTNMKEKNEEHGPKTSKKNNHYDDDSHKGLRSLLRTSTEGIRVICCGIEARPEKDFNQPKEKCGKM